MHMLLYYFNSHPCMLNWSEHTSLSVFILFLCFILLFSFSSMFLSWNRSSWFFSAFLAFQCMLSICCRINIASCCICSAVGYFWTVTIFVLRNVDASLLFGRCILDWIIRGRELLEGFVGGIRVVIKIRVGTAGWNVLGPDLQNILRFIVRLS